MTSLSDNYCLNRSLLVVKAFGKLLKLWQLIEKLYCDLYPHTTWKPAILILHIIQLNSINATVLRIRHVVATRMLWRSCCSNKIQNSINFLCNADFLICWFAHATQFLFAGSMSIFKINKKCLFKYFGVRRKQLIRLMCHLISFAGSVR